MLANENADGKLDDDAYPEQERQLGSRIEALERSARPGIPAGRDVERLRALSETWLAGPTEWRSRCLRWYWHARLDLSARIP